jgi:hypothetical protein
MSDDDAGYFRARSRVVVVPNGVDCSAYAGASTARPGPPTIHVGRSRLAAERHRRTAAATEVLAVRQRAGRA